MEGTYAVSFAGKPVGQVRVTRQGLYYHFSCRCKLSGGVVCRLLLRQGEQQENLGILMPRGDGFCLECRVAAKKCGGEIPTFQAMPSREELSGQFIPISPEEPFAYIRRLKEAFFQRRYGQAGIVLPKK